MASIPVISHNVIRQAIDWHGLPKPVDIATLSNFKFPAGKTQSTVLVCFTTESLLRLYTMVGILSPEEYGFQRQLQDCFCKDITVIECLINSRSGLTEVTLSCVLEPHDHE